MDELLPGSERMTSDDKEVLRAGAYTFRMLSASECAIRNLERTAYRKGFVSGMITTTFGVMMGAIVLYLLITW